MAKTDHSLNENLNGNSLELNSAEITLWNTDGTYAGYYPDCAAAAQALFGSESPVWEYVIASMADRPGFVNGRIVRTFDSLPPVLKLRITVLESVH